MKQTVTLSEFFNSFLLSSRRYDFSCEGLTALYDYLTELEDSCEMEIELDVIAITCDFTEYDTVYDAYRAYQPNRVSTEQALEWLQDKTQVITFDGGVIIQNF